MPVSTVIPTNLGTEFELGTNVPSKITIKTDGTSVVRDPISGSLGATAPTYDTLTKVISFPDVNGVAQPTIDLSEFTTDIFVSGGSFNTSTSILTLTDNDAGTPDVVIDLSAIKGVSTDAGQILSTGADGRALLTQASVKAQADCPVTDAFGVPIGNMFDV